jgi:hypothetical protein
LATNRPLKQVTTQRLPAGKTASLWCLKFVLVQVVVTWASAQLHVVAFIIELDVGKTVARVQGMSGIRVAVAVAVAGGKCTRVPESYLHVLYTTGKNARCQCQLKVC